MYASRWAVYTDPVLVGSAGVVFRIPRSRETSLLGASNLDMDSGGAMIVIPVEVPQFKRYGGPRGKPWSRVASRGLDSGWEDIRRLVVSFN